MADALSGPMPARYQRVISLPLEEFVLIDRHIGELDRESETALTEHHETVRRLCEMPGIQDDAARQVIAEIGPRAAAFHSPKQLASWIVVCPGRQESAGESKSDRSAKGHPALSQIAWSAVRTKDCFFQELYRRLIPRLGIHKAALAVAHRIAKLIWKILREQAHSLERGRLALDPLARQRRLARRSRQIRRLGDSIEVKPITPAS
jgi:transposase